MQEQKQKNLVGQYPAIFMTWTPRHFPNKRNKSAGQGLSRLQELLRPFCGVVQYNSIDTGSKKAAQLLFDLLIRTSNTFVDRLVFEWRILAVC